MDTAEEKRLVLQVVERLTARHSEVPQETIIAAVSDAHARFEGSRIRDFVPLFVERRVKQMLATLILQ